VDNLFSLEKYDNKSLFMVGDTVSMSGIIPFTRTGKIVSLNQNRKSNYFSTRSVEVDVNGKVYRKCPGKLRILERKQSFREHWLKISDTDSYHQKFLDDTIERQKKIQARPFFDYETFSVPLSMLKNGLEIIGVKSNDSLANAFFELALDSSVFILNDEKKCQGHSSWSSHAGEIYSSRAYAQALTGRKVDIELLNKAALHIQQYSETIVPNYWGAFAQNEYLSAVRKAIIADDMEQARSLLTLKRSFKWHKDQNMLLKKLARNTKAPESDKELMRNCLLYKEYLKNPFRSYSNEFLDRLVTFEWYVIVEKIFNNRNIEDIDWIGVVKEMYE
jgi:hypothetical protein